MLVGALVSHIAALAIPAYTGYIDRARVSRAVADIGGISLQLARWQTSFGVLPDTLADADLDGQLDPWGSPYVYLNIANANPGQLRRDKNLVPVNTDFDLYSVGKDGLTVTAFTAKSARDDVVRANDGRYVGLAENY
jgi:general secretion pathway protein G